MKYLMVSFSIFFSIISLNSFSQNPIITQVIRGKVIDEISQKPIENANIIIVNTSLRSITDENGYFKIEKAPIGRFQLKTSNQGYKHQILSNLKLDAGKELVLQIVMTESTTELEEVVVSNNLNQSKLNPVSSRTFSVDETQRFAASFYDPARLAASYPGVTTTNDQANNISIRGNSPNAMAWKLEGVEIVNPNHLTNAGTFTDRPMQNGGGTIALSAQMLGNSQFMAGAFLPEYGNATAGLFDMRLRKGNNEKREYTLQAGLLGIDLSTEGPFSKNKKASYLINYRYSFTGLLGAMGVPLGDEAIGYQDLAVNLNFPTENFGNFSVFGMWGSSNNDFEAKVDSLKMFVKDFSTINFKSNLGIIGATHQISFGKNASLRSVLAYSAKSSDRDEKIENNFLFNSSITNDFLLNKKLSFSSILYYKINAKNNLRFGTTFTKLNNNTTNTNNYVPIPYDVFTKLEGVLLQPHFNVQSHLTSKITANAGLQYQYLTFNKTSSIEPRASIIYGINNTTNITAAYANQGQMQNSIVYGYFTKGATIQEYLPGNKTLGFNKVNHFVFNINKKISQSLNVKAELYYQQHYNVLTTKAKGSQSVMNILDEYLFLIPLTNEGTAINTGLELSAEQYFDKNTYFLASATIYDAKFRGSDGINHDSKFNGKYAGNFTGGKEWDRSKKGKNRIFALNVRGIYQGGYRESPIDIDLSRNNLRTSYKTDAQNLYSLQLPDYYRVDLRLSFKRQKTNYTRTLSLDIQNVTNNLNTAYNYYDWYLDKKVEKTQLGLIPVLNWRVEF